MEMRVDLSGKVALVTGASKGIGHALALGLAAAGAAVVANYNSDRAGAEDAVARIRAAVGRATAVQGDMSRVADCRALVDACVSEFGRIDVACCHAGITNWGRFLEYEEPDFDQVVGTNLKGTYFTAQAAARQMAKQGGGGRIVVTSSITGNQAVRYLSCYGMTKGGVQMLVRNLVLELSPLGIAINAVAPGPITNERNVADDPEYDRNWGEVVPLGRVGSAEDVVKAALFFASDAAEWITGQTLLVDGGLSCYCPTPDFRFVK
jgi:glucose 1-dehydrogenase